MSDQHLTDFQKRTLKELQQIKRLLHMIASNTKVKPHVPTRWILKIGPEVQETKPR
jgi:hypothetical protein